MSTGGHASDGFLHAPTPLEDDSAYSTESSSPRDHDPIRLMQWNIHGWRDTHHNDNFEDVVSYIKRASPDILVLNEVLHPYSAPPEAESYLELVRTGNGNGYIAPSVAEPDSYLARLSEATGLVHYIFGQAVSDGYFGRFGYGNAILSRFELRDSRHIVLKADSFEYDGARRIEAEDRCVSSAIVHIPCPLRVFTTHLDQLDERLRTQQASDVISNMVGEPGSILVGDLNTYQASDYSTEAWSRICEMWAQKSWGVPPQRSTTLEAFCEAGLVDCHYLSRKDGQNHPRPTCWTIEPLFRIDYALFDEYALKEWCVVKCDCDMQIDSSDHFPLLVDLVPRV